ncbi:MAG: tetratricopeptide repeat protein [Microcystis panniformis Mp_MB_F_20051200_S9]|uniref:Tetratricopeptide repeat protein n=1 Tax=Microcystis panniformis Mp_MB_F_20051200_S9 TaxID=2486223 RepID=A0A552PTS1_9CHRO|nr:MAG: tetratricopeptide repeat protein [Microcystis panniformis Mp_MB_F_20080800_S26D]TRV51536.1 MAG: tetratricopeptide repeat protein [Microcystis panniformis Mp_GB_SS_20050300_S99]TRV52173.1 MAG: tetratricopeptide repeat protein [Microcystis panniformis Mp_GB_SS_20050300_S99D]TRV60310.1 MAG: tetratricopeptide repeat protein [Microcystis panniformis Mp_MB_F_20051200_S9]TRV61639.1 MAG: tetratricopeptide repeat protein [Microcystis panniformis Mp_MB_F_20080800_S26]TRV62830.1 MAG: tetratricope
MTVIASPLLVQTDLRQEADRLFKEGFELFQSGTLEGYQGALGKLREALKLYQQLDSKLEQAFVLDGLGRIYDALREKQTALDYYQQALILSQTVGDHSQEAATLNSIGEIYNNLGEKKKALDYYQRALILSQTVDDHHGESAILNNIGDIYADLGEQQTALRYYRQALPIRRAEGDHAAEARILARIGKVYSALGEKQKALDYYQQSLPLSLAAGDHSQEAATLSNIGAVYDALGEKQKALDYFQQSLPLSRAVGDSGGEAAILTGIGAVYYSLGEKQKALDYYQQALPLRRAVGDPSGEATTLSNIGAVYSDLGEKQKALDYYQQSLPLRRAVSDRSGEATTLNNIGGVYHDLGEKQKALDYFQQALPLRRAVGDRSGEATTLSNIGAVYDALGEKQKALDYLQQALPLSRAVGNRSGEAVTLSNIGLIYRDQGKPESAIDSWEQSANLILDLRRGVSRSLRATFLETNRGTSIALVDLLIRQNSPQKAFEWANLSTTFDLVDYDRLAGTEGQVKNPVANQAYQEWKAQARQLEALRQELQTNFSDTLSRQVLQQQAALNEQAETLVEKYPELADLLEITPTDLAQLQANLPANTTLLQPVLLMGIDKVENTVALFTLTRTTLKVQQVPVPDDLNQLLQRYANQLESDLEIVDRALSSQLYDLLIRPMAAQIAPNQTLAIIATGALQRIPFETLYDNQTQQYLLQKYPIHYLTRLSKVQPQPTPKGNNFSVLAFANPRPTQAELIGTEAQADFLQQTYPNSQIYKHQQATLDTFLSQSPRFPILHLGTHGCFRPEGCPSLGMKANTLLFANKREYELKDAVKLGLQNTELITIGACETAREVDGVGLAGLAYVWERAGAKTTLASLWNATDFVQYSQQNSPELPTAAILNQFYANLQQGMTKAEALRQAKLAHIDLHPFFWAAFILIGDGQAVGANGR